MPNKTSSDGPRRPGRKPIGEITDVQRRTLDVIRNSIAKRGFPPTIQELGATGKKEMGPVIKAVQAKAAGRADGKTISGMVGKMLP